MTAKKRVRRDPEEAKRLIMQTAERIMLEEGYCAVTVRRVAKDAGVSSTLLFYYYPTADDLLVALYRHCAARSDEMMQQALCAADPVSALWAYLTDPARTVLGIEFLALGNHRKAVRSEIAAEAERIRHAQTGALRLALGDELLESCGTTAEGLAMLLTSVSRNMVMEASVGIVSGHEDARAYVEMALARLREARQADG